jgi:hypothetical protein
MAAERLPMRKLREITPSEAVRMVPVRVVASAAPKAREGDAASLLELALPSGALLRFPAGTDLAYLSRLAAALVSC